MKGRMRPRRSLWLGLVIVAAAAAAAAVAIAAQGPADLTFTPQSERQMQNIDVGRAWAKNYYGAPSCRHRIRRHGNVGRAAEPDQQLRERGA